MLILIYIYKFKCSKKGYIGQCFQHHVTREISKVLCDICIITPMICLNFLLLKICRWRSDQIIELLKAPLVLHTIAVSCR